MNEYLDFLHLRCLKCVPSEKNLFHFESKVYISWFIWSKLLRGQIFFSIKKQSVNEFNFRLVYLLVMDDWPQTRKR